MGFYNCLLQDMLAISIDLRILLAITVVLTPVICKTFLVKTADVKLKEDKKYKDFSLQPQQTRSQRDGDMMSPADVKPTCFKDGKLVQVREFDVVKKTYIDKWRNCDGICIEATKKCNGTCDFWLQCESDDGSCIFLSDPRSSVKGCNGKCIPKE